MSKIQNKNLLKLQVIINKAVLYLSSLESVKYLIEKADNKPYNFQDQPIKSFDSLMKNKLLNISKKI